MKNISIKLSTRELLRNFKTIKEDLVDNKIKEVIVPLSNGKNLQIMIKEDSTGESIAKYLLTHPAKKKKFKRTTLLDDLFVE
jgi:hypothetical protein